MDCPLCRRPEAPLFYEDRRRRYHRCDHCRLVFVPPGQRLGAAAEKAEYDLHRNSPDDPGYRRFLGRLFEPVCREIAPGGSGLDFGSGPGPTLSVMFEDAGYRTRIYDPFYAPDPSVFDRAYDFITATEVAEHLHDPGRELERLWGCLRPGGLLGVMTKLVIDREAFSTWHYKNDPTHVCFFSRETFRWLAGKWSAALTFHGSDVILMKKPKTTASETSKTDRTYE